MYITEVFPLAKGVRAEKLHYFSNEPIAASQLLTVPLGNRKISAVANESGPIADYKSIIRNAPYELKKVTEVKGQLCFSQFFHAAKEFARFSGVTSGATIRSLLPKTIIDNAAELPAVSSDLYLPDIAAPKPKIIQAQSKKQLQYVRSLTKSRLSEEQSVFVCVPTKKLRKAWTKHLSDLGPLLSFDSSLTDTKIINRWQKAVTAETPLMLVATAPFLSLPRSDLGLVAVTAESDSAYKMQSRPFLDKRLFAKHFARLCKRDAVLVDTVLTTETQWEYREGKTEKAFKPIFHYDNGPAGSLIDMKSLPATTGSGVRLFSPKVAKLLRKTIEDNKRACLFVARRGRRPFTVCNDCGEVLECDSCGYPLVLIEDTKDKRQYICEACKQSETSLRRCENCQSWNLKALGIGIDFVADVLSEELPEVDIFQIDGRTVGKQDEVDKIINDFSTVSPALLLATQLGIDNLSKSVDNSVVVSADSLLAVPDLSVSHKLLRLLLKMREHTKENFYIQTRVKQTDIFEQALAGNVSDFYRDQIEKREQFNYPPFSYLIKLTITGKQKQQKKCLRIVKDSFTDNDIHIYPGGASQSDSGQVVHALLRIDRKRWVDDVLLEKLRNLPPQIAVNAHPQNLL